MNVEQIINHQVQQNQFIETVSDHNGYCVQHNSHEEWCTKVYPNIRKYSIFSLSIVTLEIKESSVLGNGKIIKDEQLLREYDGTERHFSCFLREHANVRIFELSYLRYTKKECLLVGRVFNRFYVMTSSKWELAGTEQQMIEIVNFHLKNCHIKSSTDLEKGLLWENDYNNTIGGYKRWGAY